jgi:CheY-like chemotaxis protein
MNQTTTKENLNFLDVCEISGWGVLPFQERSLWIACRYYRTSLPVSTSFRSGRGRNTPDRPAILLVEHRDEVFARMAADLAAAGLFVMQAGSTKEALVRWTQTAPAVCLVNLDLPDRGGSFLASYFRDLESGVPVWLYTARKSAAAISAANAAGAEELVDYGGDLWKLSDAILDCLAGCRQSDSRRSCPPDSAHRLHEANAGS